MSEVENEQKRIRFRDDLRDLLNRHSMENGSNTPDYQLADYLIACLHALDETINRRASWYGRADSTAGANPMTAQPDTRTRIEALHAEIAYLIQFEKDRIDREQPKLNGLHRQIAHAKWDVLALPASAYAKGKR